MWEFWLALVVLAYYCQTQLQCAEGAAIIPTLGVNWGSLASHPMDPDIVVNMLKDNGIKKVKLFDADSWTVSAFSGTDIEVMVGIPNDQLEKFAGSAKDAENWVKHNVSKHLHDGGVKIKYIAVGNEPFLESYNGSYTKVTFPAMQNIEKAIEKAGHAGKVKVSTPLNADVYHSSSNNPSDGQFRKEISGPMRQILGFLNDKKSPFIVNIYPFLSLQQNKDFPDNFAFFDNTGKSVSDKNTQYTNVFDANFDTLIWALKKAGYPNLDIVVGEVGWPTDGDKDANNENAKKFYKGLLKRMANKKGTPLHSGTVDVYLFALFDEDLKSIAPGNFERHWGIFRSDGRPKFPIDFSGQGQDKWPQGAKGVKYQDRKWCVLKKDAKNMTLVADALGYACAGADCTSLGIYGSCKNLDLAGNASYAFNQYFQTRDQNVEACNFNGLATVVKEDPSKGSCLFPLVIESGGEMLKAVQYLGGVLVGLFLMFVTLA